MPAVDAPVGGISRKLVGEMADIVQQSRRDQNIRLAFTLGQIGALPHMLGNGDRFADIFLRSAARKDVGQKIDDRIRAKGVDVGHAHHCRSGCEVRAARVDSSPSLSA